MGLKEGVCGYGGVGNKREGKVPVAGHSQAEALNMDTAGLMGEGGQGKHNLKEGNHNKGGGKVNLGSDRPHLQKVNKFRRT